VTPFSGHSVVRYCVEICVIVGLNIEYMNLCELKCLFFVVADVLVTVEHVKHVVSIEVQKGDSLLLSSDR